MNTKVLMALYLLATTAGCTQVNSSFGVAPKGTIDIYSVSLVPTENTKQVVHPATGSMVWLITPPILTTEDVKAVAASETNAIDANGKKIKGHPALEIELHPSGSTKVNTATKDQFPFEIAILVNGAIVSTPSIRQPLGTKLLVTGGNIESTITTLTGVTKR